jgi:hypothetical protein
MTASQESFLVLGDSLPFTPALDPFIDRRKENDLDRAHQHSADYDYRWRLLDLGTGAGYARDCSTDTGLRIISFDKRSGQMHRPQKGLRRSLFSIYSFARSSLHPVTLRTVNFLRLDLSAIFQIAHSHH